MTETEVPMAEIPMHLRPRHHQRFEKIPEGFTRFRGKKSPVPCSKEDGRTVDRVELVVLTAEGLGFSGPRRIGEAEWTVPKGELGSIVAYRSAPEQ